MNFFIKVLYRTRYVLYMLDLVMVSTLIYYISQLLDGVENDIWLLLYLIGITSLLILITWLVRKLGKIMFVNKKNNVDKVEEVMAEWVNKNFVNSFPVKEKIIEKNKDNIDFDISYDKMKVSDLKELAKEKNIQKYSLMKKAELIDALQQKK